MLHSSISVGLELGGTVCCFGFLCCIMYYWIVPMSKGKFSRRSNNDTGIFFLQHCIVDLLINEAIASAFSASCN